MYIQNKIVEAAYNMISASFVSASIQGWNIYKDTEFNKVQYPCVCVVCAGYEPMLRELNIGIGRAALEITTLAIKTATSGSVRETVNDFAFNPFLADNSATVFAGSTTNLVVKQISENGGEDTTLEDGWAALQRFEIVCGRTA